MTTETTDPAPYTCEPDEPADLDAVPGCPLTWRQLQVTRLAAEGLTIRGIGSSLFLAETTAKTHLEDAYRKAGAQSRAHLVAIALRAGWIR